MCEHKMSEDEQKVWELIRSCVGRKNAILRKMLESMTGRHERLVRDIIHNLKTKHNKLICASSSGGYFLPESIEEIRACRNIEASREAQVRENRQYYDRALSAADNKQMSMEI